MEYRELKTFELARAKGQFPSRTTEENMAYWFFPACMRDNMKRNYPIAFVGEKTAYYPDFVLFKERIIIEIDGGYHNGKRQIERDDVKDQIFNRYDFDVIRIQNEDTNVNVAFWERLIEKMSVIKLDENRKTLPFFIRELKAMREREIRLWTSLDYIPEMSLVNTHRHKKIRNLYEYLS